MGLGLGVGGAERGEQRADVRKGAPGSTQTAKEDKSGCVGASAFGLGSGMCRPECSLAWQVPNATGLSSS